MATEQDRMRAWGKRKLRQSRSQRDVDVAASTAKLAQIETLRVSAAGKVGTDNPGVTADLTTQATRIDELEALLAGFDAGDQASVESGPNTGPILTQLNGAIADANLHTSQGRTDADTHVDSAVTLINALQSEDTTAALAALASAITNLALGTNPGDTAAVANINTAIGEVNEFGDFG